MAKTKTEETGEVVGTFKMTATVWVAEKLFLKGEKYNLTEEEQAQLKGSFAEVK